MVHAYQKSYQFIYFLLCAQKLKPADVIYDDLKAARKRGRKRERV